MIDNSISNTGSTMIKNDTGTLGKLVVSLLTFKMFGEFSGVNLLLINLPNIGPAIIAVGKAIMSAYNNTFPKSAS